MTAEQNSYDEVWEKLRSEMEKKYAEDVRKQLQKDFEQKLLEHREAVNKEARKEYDLKLDEHKKDSEMRIQKMITEYEEKLRIQEDEAKQKMERIRNSISQIYNLVKESEEQFDITSEPLMALKRQEKPEEDKEMLQKSSENQDEIPPILRPEFHDFLRDVVQKLDPKSFLRFTGSNKKLRAMAKQGILQTSISLKCSTYEHSEDNQWFDDMPLALVTSYKKKALGVKELKFLNSARFFRTEMECLCLTERGFGNIGGKAMELLDYLCVQKIEYAYIDTVVDIPQFLKKYQVVELRIHSPRIPPSFLQSPEMNKVQKIDLSLHDFNRSEETKTTTHEFILASPIPKIIVNESLPACIVPKLIKLWMDGVKNFKHFYTQLELDCSALVHEELEKTNRLQSIDHSLKEIALEELLHIIPRVPSVFRGKDGIYVVIREDLQILKIIISSNFIWRWVVLHNMEEKEDED